MMRRDKSLGDTGRYARERLQEQVVSVDGCALYARYVKTAGRRTLPVVLVHGLGVSGAYFGPTLERLGRDFDVYAPDLPGHGKSGTPSQALDIAGLAGALLGWLEAMGIERAMLVGHSLGCQTVVEAALRQPARIERLVLIGPTRDPAVHGLPAQFLRAVVACSFERPTLIRHFIRDYARMGPRLLPEARAMMKDPVETKLAELMQPVMLVRGGRDLIASQRWLDRMARLLRTDRVAVIPAWGHNVNYSAAERLSAAIRPFLYETYAEIAPDD
ncbi:alpha/beta hydrolase [Halomonas shantousis]